MFERYKEKNIGDVNIKMLRRGKECFIKISPQKQKGGFSKIFVNLNGEIHEWEIYDKNSNQSHNIYFKGNNVKPIFYLKIEDKGKILELGFENEKIIQREIIKTNFEKIVSSDSTCWATAIFYSKRPDKPPFDQM